jgi:pyrimidine deaminase RibD-like protein
MMTAAAVRTVMTMVRIAVAFTHLESCCADATKASIPCADTLVSSSIRSDATAVRSAGWALSTVQLVDRELVTRWSS